MAWHVSMLTLFLSMAKYSTLWLFHTLFIHSSVDGGLGCFQFGATMNNTAINICGPVFVLTSPLNF